MRVGTCRDCGQTTISDDRPDERHLMVEMHGHVCDACLEARADQERAEASGEQLSLGALAPLAPGVPGQLGL